MTVETHQPLRRPETDRGHEVRRIAVGLAIFFGGLLVASCGSNVEDFLVEGSIAVPPDVRTLRVVLEKGSITVRASEDDARLRFEATVRKGTTRAEDLALLADVSPELREVPSSEDGEILLEGPSVPESLAERDPGAVVAMRVVLHVPRRLGLVLRTERGPIGVEDRDGPVDARTGSGELRLVGVGGDTVAFSGGGAHTVLDHSGGLDVSTEHGHFLIYLSALDPDGVHVRTETGNIQCNLVAGRSFQLQARTDLGEIECPFDLAVETRGRGQQVEGRVGGADPSARVELRVKRGNISVREAERAAAR